MDARTARLVQAIDSYLEQKPHGVPEQLLTEVNGLRDMITAPMYDNESPGEQQTRQVAEENLPEDMSQEIYSNPVEDTGAFQQ